jgi:hypothetical protein
MQRARRVNVNAAAPIISRFHTTVRAEAFADDHVLSAHYVQAWRA